MLRQRCKEESERSESMAEGLREVEKTLSEEREESQAKMTEMEALHRQQREVCVCWMIPCSLWQSLNTYGMSVDPSGGVEG